MKNSTGSGDLFLKLTHFVDFVSVVGWGMVCDIHAHAVACFPPLCIT